MQEGTPVKWRSLFDERQLKEIDLAVIYARDFHHGTTGHNALMIIAKMAALLDLGESTLEDTPENYDYAVGHSAGPILPTTDLSQA